MSRHQIFLVHGMGNFETGWSEGVRKRITDAFASYPRMSSFAAKFDFKEVTYNDTFEVWRKQWRDDAAAAAQALTDTGADSGAVGKLIQAAGAPGGGGFLATHVLDVVAFRYLKPIAETVCRSLQSQILGHLNSFPANDLPRYSVVAHSLGTSVVYESFQAMLTQGVAGSLLTTAFRPVNVFMVANTAKLLWNKGGSAYPAVLSPDLTDDSGLCLRFSNFRHALDPVPAVDRFNPPDDWFAPTAPKDQVYLDATLPADDVQDINVHSFEQYLSHPNVHVPMLRQLTGFASGIAKAEVDAALAAWRAQRLQNTALAKAQAQLQALFVKPTSDWSKEVEMLLALRKLVAGSPFGDGET